jgi:hypothetical protein
MRFLLRLAFWLAVVLVLLPSGGSQPAAKVNVSAFDAVSAAGAAVSDMRQFCGRQADACVVGSQVAAWLGQRAQAGAKMLYEYLGEQFAPQETASVGKPNDGKRVPRQAAPPSQHTLTADATHPQHKRTCPRLGYRSCRRRHSVGRRGPVAQPRLWAGGAPQHSNALYLCLYIRYG